MEVKYFHPSKHEGKYLSAANVIWAERDRGGAYYRFSRFAGRNGKFSPDHPCCPNGSTSMSTGAEIGSTEALVKFRERGYWASCFPEGDGMCLKWWGDDIPEQERDAAQVKRDIEDCFGWTVTT